MSTSNLHPRTQASADAAIKIASQHIVVAPAKSIAPFATLPEWLDYIGRVHPKSISMGLERVDAVKRAMRLYPSFPIITVSGTNGKGSTCAMMEAILTAAGHRVGCYTSPHLLRFNERVSIDRGSVADDRLVRAFGQVESARNNVALTYFEFSTLAAMKIFVDEKVDVGILEVGLGGRLDAVNIFDADCAVITSIAMDHMDYLGNTRDEIAFEKAGIFRTARPAVCSEPNVPGSMIRYGQEIGADFMQIGQTFNFAAEAGLWRYWRGAYQLSNLPYPALQGGFQLRNASAAITALASLESHRLSIHPEHIVKGLEEVALPGRFQVIQESPTIILDVAHNPEAAESLAANLGETDHFDKTIAVFAMLSDKDIAGVIHAVKHLVDVWLVADIRADRGAHAEQLVRELEKAQVAADRVVGFPSPEEAYIGALQRAGNRDRIVVFGSFYTVAAALRLGQK